ncbi:MAG TPA: hypothetical protein VHV09_05440, partial [Trebonia sp.]|nr:hypothetical protein [Trebonia sp.]
MSHWDFGHPSADDDYPTRSDDHAERSEEWDDGLAPYPLTFEREPGYPGDRGYLGAGAPEPRADEASAALPGAGRPGAGAVR